MAPFAKLTVDKKAIDNFVVTFCQLLFCQLLTPFVGCFHKKNQAHHLVFLV
jgi:hypothetical protein